MMMLKWTQIVSTLTPQITYIYILLMLGYIGAKLGGLYHDDAKMDTNCVDFNIPHKLHLKILLVLDSCLGEKLGTLYKDVARV